MTTMPISIPAYPELTALGASKESDIVENLVGEIEEHLDQADAYQPLVRALQQLESVYEQYSEADWDGYGALPVSFKAYDEAERFLYFLEEEELPYPDISPEVDGGIEFEWYLRPDFLFSISLAGNSIIGYSGLFLEGNTIYGTEKCYQTIPNTIHQLISRFI